MRSEGIQTVTIEVEKTNPPFSNLKTILVNVSTDFGKEVYWLEVKVFSNSDTLKYRNFN